MTPGPLDHRHLWHPFTPMASWLAEEPLVIAAAEGCELIDDKGQRYLDGVSSLWANVHGHRHPHIDAAVRAQLDRVAHSTLLGLTHEPAIRLAARLCSVAPPGLTRVFYSDSGSTAVEAALKIALQFHQHRGDTARTRFIALEQAYHGDTLGAVSVGGMDVFHAAFAPLLFPALHTPPDADALERTLEAHPGEVAAVILEPLVQGAAGMRLQPPGFLARASALCKAHGALLIVDEVATGFGRTGTLFACEQESVTPDLMALAKGLSGGYLPLAATLASEQVFSAFLGPRGEYRTFFHGHTFTGNPLACAAGIASLEVFEQERTIERIQGTIHHLQRLLDQAFGHHPNVREVRQRGLMVGIELRDRDGATFPPMARTGAQVCREARRRGAILRPLGDVVVLMPQLCISSAQLERLVATTRLSLDHVIECPPSS